jgi:hypothetical protein
MAKAGVRASCRIRAKLMRKRSISGGYIRFVGAASGGMRAIPQMGNGRFNVGKPI